MNKEAATLKQGYNVKLSENYYSKPEYSYWYDYRLIDKSTTGEETPTALGYWCKFTGIYSYPNGCGTNPVYAVP